MKTNRFNIFLFLLAILLPTVASADSFVRASISKKTVYPTEPLELRIKAYTSTWFTGAPDLYDLQIPNAFTYRDGRPILGMDNINGKRYTTTEFVFIVFPGIIGEMEIPSMEVEYATPDEGDYKGKTKRSKTKKITFNVRPVPKGYNGKDWVIANNISLSERWEGLKDTLLVGDVLYRTFRVKGNGVPKALLPRVVQDSINLGSVYLKSPNREMFISEEGVISSSYSERVTMLLEKAGTLLLPEVKYSFWDLQLNKQVNRTLKARTIVVKENPNLAMLQTLQDSLASQTKVVKAEEPLTILGLKPVQFVALCLVFIGLVVVLYRFLKRIVLSLKAKRQAYLESEGYAFKQVTKAVKSGKKEDISNRISQWHIQSKDKTASPSLKEEAWQQKRKGLFNAFVVLEKTTKSKDLLKEIISYRKSRNKTSESGNGTELNPR